MLSCLICTHYISILRVEILSLNLELVTTANSQSLQIAPSSPFLPCMWSSAIKANSSTYLAGERLTTCCRFSDPTAHLRAACPTWGSCVSSECTDFEVLMSVWHSLMMPVQACTFPKVQWDEEPLVPHRGTRTPQGCGESAREVAISYPLASPMCCDSLRKGAPGSTPSQMFSSKLVWTVLCEQGISLSLNPLPGLSDLTSPMVFISGCRWARHVFLLWEFCKQSDSMLHTL